MKKLNVSEKKEERSSLMEFPDGDFLSVYGPAIITNDNWIINLLSEIDENKK